MKYIRLSKTQIEKTAWLHSLGEMDVLKIWNSPGSFGVVRNFALRAKNLPTEIIEYVITEGSYTEQLGLALNKYVSRAVSERLMNSTKYPGIKIHVERIILYRSHLAANQLFD